MQPFVMKMCVTIALSVIIAMMELMALVEVVERGTQRWRVALVHQQKNKIAQNIRIVMEIHPFVMKVNVTVALSVIIAMMESMVLVEAADRGTRR